MVANVGLIGKGRWGSKLKSKLIKKSNLKFICGKETNYSKLIKQNNINWVFIATPNKTHYQMSLVKGLYQKRHKDPPLLVESCGTP